MKKRFFTIILSCLLIAIQPANAISNEQLKIIRDGFTQRRDHAFEQLKGTPLVIAKKKPPLEPGRALYTRDFSFSLVDFAFKSFWLKTDIELANRALDENSNYYTDNMLAMKDRDSFYWAADELCRIVDFFGTNGSKDAGLLTKESEAKIYKMMWQYVKVFSRISQAEYKISETWYVDESENHHIQRFSTYWHFSKLLKDLPDYKLLKYDDGFTATEHYNAWTIYAEHWIVERAKKGLFIEMANEDYNMDTLKGVYNFFDFGDKKLQNLSRMLLDLYWATWAEEQINGVRGGSKNRVYPKNSKFGRRSFWAMAWYYFGNTEPTPLTRNTLTFVTSSYQIPLVVMDLALNKSEKGNYEIKEGRLGLAVKGFHVNPEYHLKTDKPSLMRYSYCTPDFILGTAFFEAKPFEDWTMISSQNRWQGVIFDGDPDARIYPQCSDDETTRSYNQHWSVQNKGCLITQKLPDEGYSSDGRPMRVFFSKAGLTDMVEKQGWVFVKSNGAFAAVKCASKGYAWIKDSYGKWLMCEDQYSPIIMQVVQKSNFKNYQEFQEKILSEPIHYNGKVLSYHSIENNDFIFNTDRSKLPSVNGKTVDIAPKMVFDSPFIQSVFNSGVIRISKGENVLELNFSAE